MKAYSMVIDFKNILKNILIYTLILIISFDCMNVFGLISPGPLLLNALKIWNLCLILLYVIFFKKEIQLKDLLITILFIPLFWIYIGEENIIISFLKIISKFVPLFSFFILKDELKIEVLNMWLKFYTITLVPALIIHILKNAIGIDFPSIEVHNYLGEDYDTHFYLYFYNKWNYIRFCGIYDEPGIVGTFSYLFLFFLNDSLSKFQKIVLWLSGLFSLSFFFLAMIPFIIILQLYRKKKFLKLSLFVFAIVSLALITPTMINMALSSNNKSSVYQDIIFHTIKTRLDVDEKSNSVESIKTNRLNTQVYTYDDFKKENIITILFGNYMTSSSKEFGDKTGSGLGLEIYLYQYGLFIFLYTIILTFLINYLPRNNGIYYTLFYFLITLVCFYQRPFIYKLEFIIIIYTGALLYHQSQLKKKELLISS